VPVLVLGFRKTDGAYAKDRMGNFMAGVTGQIKII
jgi:OOP family OmpA-OmpF porin